MDCVARDSEVKLVETYPRFWVTGFQPRDNSQLGDLARVGSRIERYGSTPDFEASPFGLLTEDLTFDWFSSVGGRHGTSLEGVDTSSINGESSLDSCCNKSKHFALRTSLTSLWRLAQEGD